MLKILELDSCGIWNHLESRIGIRKNHSGSTTLWQRYNFLNAVPALRTRCMCWNPIPQSRTSCCLGLMMVGSSSGTCTTRPSSPCTTTISKVHILYVMYPVYTPGWQIPFCLVAGQPDHFLFETCNIGIVDRFDSHPDAVTTSHLDPDPDPDRTLSYTHVEKWNVEIFLLLLTTVPVYIVVSLSSAS